MSVLVVGLSHRTAPVPVLERMSVSSVDLVKLLDELRGTDSISEVLVLSTCNRVEVYADVARFHPALADVSAVLSRHSGLSVSELGDHLYVHFAEAAAEHMISVACGLDSMVVGESQILGQLRAAYQACADAGTVGSVLHELSQTALRVAKRVHTDTGIDRVGASVVSVALDHAETVLGEGLAGRSALIVGAGSMGALAAATLRRRGVTEIVVTNRSVDGGVRLAASTSGRFAPLSALADEIAKADLLVSVTGATTTVVGRDQVGERDARPLVILDLAMPRDVDPAVVSIAGVHYADLDSLTDADASESDVAAAAAIVAAELAGYLAEQQRLAVAPTVTALRARANQVIDAELTRLDARLPGLESRLRSEVADAVRRAVEKVLHAPTVRVKELATTPEGDSYARALRELFDLDPAAAESVAVIGSHKSRSSHTTATANSAGHPTGTAAGASSSPDGGL
jgi:glutamyl-tRNA reductase